MGADVLSKIHSVALAFLLIGAGLADSQSAARKLSAIQTGATRPGSRIFFTPAELNAWMRDEARARVPQGVRNLRLELGYNRATGFADIDFLKLHQSATGQPPGWLMKNLFAGERPVTVVARFQSRNGQARVDVERVEISGIAIEGATLQFVIDNYVRPTFPDVKVDEWFGLRYGIERFTVAPAGVTVVIAK
jgi:hypothetical protein